MVSSSRGSVALVTLGCTRNEVDSEELAGRLAAEGWTLVDDAADADVAVVNTCGFVEQAKKDSLDTLRDEGAPEGTVRQYKSEWNTHVPADIGTVRCADTAIWHYTRVFSSLLQEKASEQVVKNVARTLGHVIQFGVDHGYFEDHDPVFGFPHLNPSTRNHTLVPGKLK